jgi:hypothetical protein
MFGLFKKRASEIQPANIRTATQMAIYGAFPLTCHMFAISPRKDGETFTILYAESLAFATCLIQMRAQGKFKFNDVSELSTFIQTLTDEYVKFCRSDWLVPIKYEGMVLTKDVFDIVTDKHFVDRTFYYCGRDYIGLGISEATFNEMAKGLGYIPALVRGTSDDMALVMYQIWVSLYLFRGGGVSEENGFQLFTITRASRDGMIRTFDKVLTD